MANRMKSLRDLFAKLGPDGKVRHALRSFNLGMTGREVPSVQKLAAELGIDIYLLDMPSNCRGSLVADTFSESGYRIEVNKRDDVRIRRWTVLHEIMHFLLHKQDDPFATALNRAGGDHLYFAHEQKQEREADQFVEALIFGDGALKAAIDLHGNDLPKLAKRFGVTEYALSIALSKL